jgi:hypothetical protein
MRSATLAALVFSLLTFTAKAQNPTANITGRILDLQTGEPIIHATISITGQTKTATTGDDGRFTLEALDPGSLDLRVSSIGYGLLKRHVELAPGQTLEVNLLLGQEGLRDSRLDNQQVTVTAQPFDAVVPDALTQYSLNLTELQDLSTVLVNDPFRAVASLPGVNANQDFYSDFAVRGAGPGHVGVYIDGVLIDHSSYSLEDNGDLGSISVVNGDVVRSVSLLSGAFPSSYGNRTGAILDVVTRDGARDGINTRFIADVLGASLTSEGPIGKARKAAWLVSGRQSYLAYVLERLGVGGGLSLNFTDGTGKLTYELNPHQRFSVDVAYGTNGASRSPNYNANQVASFFTHGSAQNGVSSLHWDWIPSPDTLLQTQIFWTHDSEHDINYVGAVDLETTTNIYGGRSDLTHQARKWSKLQAGVELRAPNQQRASFTQWNYATHVLSANLLPLDTYTKSALEPGGYVRETATLGNNRLALSVGGRWGYFTPSAQNVWLPQASVLLKATRSTGLSLAFGQYAQPPSLLALYGAFGNPGLRAERATHETFALDQFLSEKVRIHLELYNRQEHEDIFSPTAEFRLLPSGQVGFPVLGPTLANSLDAYARGFEITIQRRSANRLSGWVAYARSYAKDWQPGTALSFAGDFDQRNTFSAYAAYRITRTINVSGNTRFGTGLPISGFLAPPLTPIPNGGGSNPVVFLLSQNRNTLRHDDYQRTDIRANKIFNTRRFNLTIHGELENLTGHVNSSYYHFLYPPNVSSSHAVDATRQSLLPFLPAAGLTVEF